MTPLAHRIVKELTLPMKRRTFKDGCNLLKNMDDIHCFECTEIKELSIEVGHRPAKSLRNLGSRYRFQRPAIPYKGSGCRF